MFNSKIGPPEIYRFEVVDKGFDLTIKASFYKYLLSQIASPDALTKLSEIPKTEVDSLVIFHILLPFLNLDNVPTESNLGRCVHQISFLLKMFDLFSDRSDNTADFYLGDDPQLITIYTVCVPGSIYGGCGMEVNFEVLARKLLATQYTKNEIVHVCEEAIFNFYYGVHMNKEDFEKKRKQFLCRKYTGWENISVVIESEGNPQFKVPTGNCACLGSNGSSFKSLGKMSCHNVDRPSQHLAMLAGVVTLWNQILKPLYEESKK